MSYGISKKNSFLLRIWYMDCVEKNGNTFIAYTAQLNWKTIYLTFSYILINRDNGKSYEKSSLSKIKSPFFKKNILMWTPEELINEGLWEKSDESIGEILHSTSNGFMNWNCAQTKSKAHVKVGGGIEFKGLGHTQFLEMTLQPWAIPYDTMRWGRFISEKDTVIWIQWRGKTNKDLFYLNGELIEDSHFFNDEIRLGHGNQVLTLLESVVLRSGRLNKTIFAAHPIFKNIFPDTVQYAKETKWKSKAVLTKSDGTTVSGWAIHDFVQWG